MRHAQTLNKLNALLVPGQVYRRAELATYSTNIDRHLAQLVAQGKLKKISQGLYAAPKATAFGESPPDTESLVKSFLKDDHFVVYGLSQFNALGLGTTQLYNQLIVFNRKRVGEFTLGDRTYSFHRWREAPKQLTPEFLVVELLNRLDQLPEDRLQVLERLKAKLPSYNRRRLLISASKYGTIASQRKLKLLLEDINKQKCSTGEHIQ